MSKFQYQYIIILPLYYNIQIYIYIIIYIHIYCKQIHSNLIFLDYFNNIGNPSCATAQLVIAVIAFASTTNHSNSNDTMSEPLITVID